MATTKHHKTIPHHAESCRYRHAMSTSQPWITSIMGWTSVIALAFAAQACGGGASDESSGGPTSSARRDPAPASIVTSTSSADPMPTTSSLTATSLDSSTSLDPQRALDAVITLDDMPPGWRASPRTDPENKAAEVCYGGSFSEQTGGATARSKDFAKDEASFAMDTLITSEPGKPAALLARLRKEETQRCINDALKKASEEELRKSDEKFDGVDTEFGELSTEKIGDDVVALEAAVTVRLGGLSPTFYVDFYFVQVGRGLIGLTFQDSLSPFGDGRDELLAKGIEKMRAALA